MGQVFDANHLPVLSDGELIQAYVDVMVAFGATENVAKKNRLAGYESEIFKGVRSRGRERPMLHELAQHTNDTVRSWARSNLKWLDNPPPPSPPLHPLRRNWIIPHPPR
jgi:hypothetical protein